MQSRDDMIEMGRRQAIPIRRLHANGGQQRDVGLLSPCRCLMDRTGPTAICREIEAIVLRQRRTGSRIKPGQASERRDQHPALFCASVIGEGGNPPFADIHHRARGTDREQCPEVASTVTFGLPRNSAPSRGAAIIARGEHRGDQVGRLPRVNCGNGQSSRRLCRRDQADIVWLAIVTPERSHGLDALFGRAPTIGCAQRIDLVSDFRGRVAVSGQLAVEAYQSLA